MLFSHRPTAGGQRHGVVSVASVGAGAGQSPGPDTAPSRSEVGAGGDGLLGEPTISGAKRPAPAPTLRGTVSRAASRPRLLTQDAVSAGGT